MYQGYNLQREEAPKESMEDKMVRMFSELRHDVTNMRQEWKQDLRQEISTIRQEVSNLRQENNASLRHLETLVAQNSKALAERPQGTLPSTTVNNPRERVQAVILRSGKELPEPILKKNTISKNPIEEEKVEEILEEGKEQEKETSPLSSSPKAAQSRDKGKEEEDLSIKTKILMNDHMFEVWKVSRKRSNETWSIPNGEEIMNKLQEDGEKNKEKISVAFLRLVEHFDLVLKRKSSYACDLGLKGITSKTQEKIHLQAKTEASKKRENAKRI
nr:Transposase, Ptta/En/Spm, plant [Ipomoea batatas]